MKRRSFLSSLVGLPLLGLSRPAPPEPAAAVLTASRPCRAGYVAAVVTPSEFHRWTAGEPLHAGQVVYLAPGEELVRLATARGSAGR